MKELTEMHEEVIRLAARVVADFDDDDRAALEVSMGDLSEALDDLSDGVWEGDPRRTSTDPTKRAAWMAAAPGRKTVIGTQDEHGWSMVSDGWGLLSFPGQPPQTEHEPDRVLPPDQWHRVTRVRHAAVAVDPQRVTDTSSGLRGYRVGPAVFDADRVEEWVLEMGPAIPPVDAVGPAVWMGDGWLVALMPVTHEPSDIVDGWDREHHDA
jgi:hypothetical protein